MQAVGWHQYGVEFEGKLCVLFFFHCKMSVVQTIGWHLFTEWLKLQTASCHRTWILKRFYAVVKSIIETITNLLYKQMMSWVVWLQYDSNYDSISYKLRCFDELWFQDLVIWLKERKQETQGIAWLKIAIKKSVQSCAGKGVSVTGVFRGCSSQIPVFYCPIYHHVYKMNKTSIIRMYSSK